MRSLYNVLTHLTYGALNIAQVFSKKMKLFVQGRKESFTILSEAIQDTDRCIWFHCASLGEYEQGVPIIEAVKRSYPNHKIVITFFSPSGYEVKKKTPLADVVLYLPFDTQKNAMAFVSKLKPSLVFFIKYEVWPNYLQELKNQNIPVLLVSGLFRERQAYFKWYGSYMRSALSSFTHLFVQDERSKTLLNTIGIANSSISGDTRFDRVSHQIELDNRLAFMETFAGNSKCIVFGSTWPEDENLFLDYINHSEEDIKFVIAPHKIDHGKIENLRNRLKRPSVLYSEMNDDTLVQARVLIVDTIGYLTKIYSYAHVAYVGGAAGSTGLHNILEPATYGVPIVIGENFKDFPEAIKLQQLAGLFSVATSKECSNFLRKLMTDEKFRQKAGMICGHFVNSNTGATKKIMTYVTQMELT